MDKEFAAQLIVGLVFFLGLIDISGRIWNRFGSSSAKDKRKYNKESNTFESDLLEVE